MMRAFAVLIISVLLMGVAFAAPHTPDSAHAATEAVAHAQEHAKHGPPQFDVSTFPSQLFWLVLSFGSLYLLLASGALPRIEQGITARAAHVASLLADANRMKEEAIKHKSDMAASLDAAYQKAHAALNKAAMDASELSNRRNHELEAVLAARLKASEERIAAVRRNAMLSILEASEILVPAIVQKLTDLRLTPAQTDAVVNAAGSTLDLRGAA